MFPSLDLKSIPFLWNFRLSPISVSFPQDPLQESLIKTISGKWEVRYFWPLPHEDIIIPAFDSSLFQIENYRHKIHDDCYLLTQDKDLNLKVRSNELLVKKQLVKSEGICGFLKKERIPLSLRKDEFSSLPQNNQISQVLFEISGKKSPFNVLPVLKESMRIKLDGFHKMHLEFSRVFISDQIFLSLCLEGKNFHEIKFLNNILGIPIPPLSYTEFLLRQSSL
jgi:hypothetical protein